MSSSVAVTVWLTQQVVGPREPRLRDLAAAHGGWGVSGVVNARFDAGRTRLHHFGGETPYPGLYG